MPCPVSSGEVQQLQRRLRDAEAATEAAQREGEQARAQHEQQQRRASEEHDTALANSQRQCPGGGWR